MPPLEFGREILDGKGMLLRSVLFCSFVFLPEWLLNSHTPRLMVTSLVLAGTEKANREGDVKEKARGFSCGRLGRSLCLVAHYQHDRNEKSIIEYLHYIYRIEGKCHAVPCTIPYTILLYGRGIKYKILGEYAKYGTLRAENQQSRFEVPVTENEARG